MHGLTLEDGAAIDVERTFVVMGLHRVFNDLARELGADLEDSAEPADQRHVLVDTNSETSVPGLFAVGDMTRRHERSVMKQVYTAQEYAVRAVDLIDRRGRSRRRRALLGESSGPAAG